MSTEPINIFAREGDPAGVARLLRELHPSVAFDGPDHDWRTATLTFGRLWSKRTLTFTYNPEYHAEPNWSMQMDGMRGYFQRFPESGRKQVAVALPTTFRFSLASILAPDLKPGADPRFDVITAVARHLDGVLFTPSGLRDSHGRVLFSAGGEAEEDPRAAWPRVVAEVRVPAAPGGGEVDEEDDGDDDGDEIDSPTAGRVARRALALAALTARASLEQDARAPGAAERHRELLEWVREMGIEDELEGPAEWRAKKSNERDILASPPGGMTEQEVIDSLWRSEGLAVLAWALGLYELPPHDEPADVDELCDAVGLLETYKARGLLESPVLRPREEIGELRKRLLGLHWRLRDYTLRPRRMDFATFARDCWFGPLDLTGIALAEGDLALRGVPIDQADPAFLGAVHSAAQERHVAVNWLSEGPDRYSEADAST